MDTQTIADGTAAIISLIVLATLAALWLVSWAYHWAQSKVPPPESHADRWKRIEAEVTARMQEHARQFEERLAALEAAQSPPPELSAAAQSELETLLADSRQREASGERWEEYTGDGR